VLTPEAQENAAKLVEKSKVARETPFGPGTERSSADALQEKTEALKGLGHFSYSALGAVYARSLDAVEELADKIRDRADAQTQKDIDWLKTDAQTARAIESPEHCQNVISGFKNAIGKVVDDTTETLKRMQDQLNENLLLGE
jgi:hypothetical protein